MHHKSALLGSATLGIALTAGLLAGSASAAPVAADTQRAPGWTSTFNANKNGWANVKGNWTLGGGALKANGIAGKRTSVKHHNNYSDFYYRVDMWRSGNSTGHAANALVIRGNPNQLNSTWDWKPSYMFQYTNIGYYSVWRTNPDGTYTAILPWTTTSVVKGAGAYNRVEVWASGDWFDFHINGVHLWSGYHTGNSFGQVGVSNYTEPGKTSLTRLNYAKLSPSATRVEHRHAAPAAGKTVPGGSVNFSPAD